MIGDLIKDRIANTLWSTFETLEEREQPEEIYLRQLLGVRCKRGKSFGRKVVEILRTKFWPANKRLTVDVLVHNSTAATIWRAVG